MNIHTESSPIRLNIEQIEKVCKCLFKRNVKASGPCAIRNELIEYETEKLYDYLAQLFRRRVNERTTPVEQKPSIILTLR